MSDNPLDELINYRMQRALFNKDFVHSGIIPTDISVIYNDLFMLRQESDYEDFFSVDESVVQPMFNRVEIFIETIRNLL